MEENNTAISLTAPRIPPTSTTSRIDTMAWLTAAPPPIPTLEIASTWKRSHHAVCEVCEVCEVFEDLTATGRKSVEA